MHRARLERARTLRTWRAHHRIVHGGEPAGCICEEQPGRFRKGQRRAGCDVPRCWICHRAKLSAEPTPQEYRASYSHYEWARELGLRSAHPRRPW